MTPGTIGDSASPTSTSRHKAVLPALLGVFVVLRTLGPVSDPDAFWHIAAGSLLRTQHDFTVTSDPWSATATQPWILNQWLPEVVMSWANSVGGLPAVAWLQALAALLVMATIWATCRARASIITATLVTAVVFVALSGSISPRPQMVTFALLAITAHIWLRTSVDLRPRWWLIPLSWVWACSHGLWFLGPAVGGVVIVGMLLDRRLALRDAPRLAAIPLASVAVAALTPVGPALLASPFQVAGVTRYISEWQPTRILDVASVAMLALIALPVLRMARGARPGSWVTILLLGSALALGLMQARTVGVAAIMAAPLAADSLHRVTGLRREAGTRRELVIAATAFSIALAAVGALAPAVAAKPGRGPNGLDTKLDALPAGTVLCNDMTIGGWLIYRHPDLKVVFDTRVEIYTPSFIESYQRAMAGSVGWQDFVQTTGCTGALVYEAAPLATVLKQGGWGVAGSSDGMVLLSQPGT